jgi:hypothetical protein
MVSSPEQRQGWMAHIFRINNGLAQAPALMGRIACSL